MSTERYVFPGVTPFLDEAIEDPTAWELKDRVRNVSALDSIASHCAQACDASPENREAIFEHVHGHREVLAAALKVADAMIDKVRGEIGEKPRKKAKADEVPQDEPTHAGGESSEPEDPEADKAPIEEPAPAPAKKKPGRPKGKAK